MRRMFAAVAVACAALVPLGSRAFATSLDMTATYYTVAGSYNGPDTGDSDFQTNPCCIGSPYTNEVTNTLGPDGLPVYNPGYNSPTGANPGAPTLYDVNGKGELTWWSPAQNSHVVYTGTGTVSIPYDNPNFYAPNGIGTNGDGNGFQTAIFRGELVVPTTESVQFTFGADDDAFLALGNTVISQEGGIHGVDEAPVTTSILDPGTYDLTLFYADRHTTGAGLYFSVDTSGVTVTPPPVSGTPEPSTWLLMFAGIGGIGLMLRQAKQKMDFQRQDVEAA
jgi:fibro-slime domain-containing protein